MVEVELLRTVPSLGMAGERKVVSPGYARNKLFPAGVAAYVTADGQVVMPVRAMLVARAREATLQGQEREWRRQREQDSELSRRSQEAQRDAQLAREQAMKAVTDAEESALAQLVSIESPIVFRRRPINPSNNLSASSSEIYGSVTTADVQAALKDLVGIAIDDSASRFLESRGIVSGRVKAIGSYNFLVQLKTIQKEATVPIQVRPEE